MSTVIHNARSRKHPRKDEQNSIKSTDDNIDKFDISKFVDKLIDDAKKIDKKIEDSKKIKDKKPIAKENTSNRRRKPVHKKKITEEADESNYDSLGLDDNVKDQIVRSNTPELNLKEMEQIFRSSNAALAYKKVGETLRSGGGLALTGGKKEGKVLRSVDRPRNRGTELIFDLEDDGEDFGEADG